MERRTVLAAHTHRQTDRQIERDIFRETVRGRRTTQLDSAV